MQTLIAVIARSTHIELMGDSAHRGVNADDPRNRGVIAHFRPPEVTEAYVRDRLAAVMRNASPSVVEARVAEVMAKIAATPHRRSPPMSQPLEAAPDPLYGLGCHPDIIERLWRMDSALPETCRWLLWGGPALVHPLSGVVFAVGFGTIGIVVHQPPGADKISADERDSPAGPEWRHLSPRDDDDAGLCRAAYNFAA